MTKTTLTKSDAKFYGTMENAMRLMKQGNAKIGRDTLIFNMGSASDCPSKALGLCQLDNCRNCYAFMAELRFPSVLAYRRKQEKMWKETSAFVLAMAISAKKTKKTRFVRFNESGDLWDQASVDKLIALAEMLPDLTFFGYTARKDLDFEARPDNLKLNGSNWKRGNMNQFVAIETASGNNPKCFGDCSKCNLCKVEAGLVIENELHGPAYNYKTRKKAKKRVKK